MFENLTVFVNRLEELNQRMFDPVVAADAKGYAELMKEYKNLEPIVEKYREYLKAVQTVEDSAEMLGESGLEREMKEMIQQELDDARDRVERTAEELKILLLPRDPNDGRRGGGSVFGAAVPHVQHVRDPARLENRAFEC